MNTYLKKVAMMDTNTSSLQNIESLNPEQRRAVEHTAGPLLIIAGAGSGKTRIITMRIAHLILHENVHPASIVALTFTNKAANEMKERIAHLVGDSPIMPYVGTFHAYCLNQLKRHQHLVDTPFFSIMDADDQDTLLRSILQRHHMGKHTSVKAVRHHISSMKNTLNPDIILNTLPTYLRDIITAYETEKRASKCLDFDDLLREGLGLFSKQPFRSDSQEIVRHILVDEYQDTNTIQHALLLRMATKANKDFAIDSLCVVGDEDQSIYSWRGATIANIQNFTTDFPGTTIIKVEQNYRSVQPILEAANAVIANNGNRIPKNLWSARAAAKRVIGVSCLSEYHEGQTIASFMAAASGKHSLSSLAVLYRAHFQSRAIEEAFIRNAIPYVIIGGTQFYERKEIKDLIAYLRLVVNPFDRTSLLRIINTPARGLGAKVIETIQDVWQHEPFLTYHAVLEKIIEQESSTAKRHALMKFIKLFEGLTPQSNPREALEQILQSIAYTDYLQDAYDAQEAQTRRDNIQELLHAADYWKLFSITTLDAFLDNIALMQENYSKDAQEKERVVLMTLHAAKGLEFDCVVLAGLEDGVLPSGRSRESLDALEEERRLLYVGITRARERLLLTRCRYRYVYGAMTEQQESPFWQEVPKHLMDAYQGSSLTPTQTHELFTAWLSNTAIKESMTKPFTPRSAPAIKPAAPQPAAPTRESSWKVHQPVRHTTFGVGIIEHIEKRTNDTMIVTVKFKNGTKKIAHTFLTLA